MRFSHNARIYRGQIDAAPFLGVFFLLLIFLLLHSSFVFTPGVPITLPEGANLPGTAKPTAVVAVDSSGYFYFENQLCDQTRLQERLQAAMQRSHEPLTLVVQMDKDAKVAVLARLGMMAQALGIREMLQAVRPPVTPVPAATPPAR